MSVKKTFTKENLDYYLKELANPKSLLKEILNK